MEFLVDGKKYDVRFQTRRRADHFLRRKGSLRDTYCSISTIDDSKTGKDRFSVVADGTAYLSHRDTYNKWAGRKLAFHRALQVFPREYREDFWERYRKVYEYNSNVSMDGCKEGNTMNECVRNMDQEDVYLTRRFADESLVKIQV